MDEHHVGTGLIGQLEGPAHRRLRVGRSVEANRNRLEGFHPRRLSGGASCSARRTASARSALAWFTISPPRPPDVGASASYEASSNAPRVAVTDVRKAARS